jgi:hypothetical protein
MLRGFKIIEFDFSNILLEKVIHALVKIVINVYVFSVSSN